MVSSRVKKRSRSRRRSKRTQKKQSNPVVYHRDAGDGVRGWDKNKPKRRSDRRKLMKLCGPKCFGSPKTLGFPVCPVHI